MDLPPKLFFRIGEVAGLVGVEPHVLRYWEREFRSIRPTKSAKGQRVYSRKDVENLLRVRDLLYRDGFTIAGARRKLRGGAELRPGSPDDEVGRAATAGAGAARVSAIASLGVDAEGGSLLVRPKADTLRTDVLRPSTEPRRPSRDATARITPDAVFEVSTGRTADVVARTVAAPINLAPPPTPSAPSAPAPTAASASSSASAQVASPSTAHAPPTRNDLRETLMTMRAEVEAFLAELSPRS